MAPSESFKPHTDRLAGLLADARGTAILDELQLIAQRRDGAGATPCRPATATGQIGVWRLDEDGRTLRRDPNRGDASWWADTAEVPLRDGVRRVVLIGESVARGWIYDPEFNPAMALERQLAKAAGEHQLIDLARAGICAEELTKLVEEISQLAPDCVVVIAGNNWATLPFAPTIELFDDLANALRTGGYAALRELFIDTVVLPRAREFLDRLVALHVDHGTQVVVVIPEFNLQGWAPPADVDVPVLANGMLDEWYDLRRRAATTGDERRWADVAEITRLMRSLDLGMSPVPGTLLARAARELGDGAAARDGLEQARDALVGVSVAINSQITSQIQALLVEFAGEHDFPCVDLRAVLAGGPSALPDPAAFLDYCHLSDEAIERAMSAVADAVLGLSRGTSTPGQGAPQRIRALARLLAATQSAYVGQPTEVIEPQLRRALEDDPQVHDVMSRLLDILEGAGPVWTHAGIEALATVKSAREIFGPMLLAGMRSDRMWTLRACLGQVLDRTPPAGPMDVNLMSTADSMDRQRPDCKPRRSFWRLTAERTTLAFAIDRPLAGTLRITYRMPAGRPDTVASTAINDVTAGTFPTTTRWATTEITLPAHATHPGVNWVHLHWPVPTVDADDWHTAEAATVLRGGFPAVAPVFGELFDARLTLTSPER